MKKIFTLIFLSASFYIRAQQFNKCSIQQIQLEIYDFTAKNLDLVKGDFNQDFLIEAWVNFENNKVTDVQYFLISSADDYSGANKKSISVSKKLHELISEKFKCFETSTEIGIYNEQFRFRIPLSENNIKTAIREVSASKE
ncbi:hypothetical protein SAMN05444377_11724 [Flavobacterium fontis]|uniref:Uncharacterized protein n=1 Tax=Flavobacterium fontis TaxID=1124188 RepID=A0A1M5E1E8_9FLAO|nr:hypothetical protein [Flavobacterium fontis]SHF72944.1 hypothetical protein SAMN05444377_11724 [Flavobacterium fontis]